MSWTSFQQVLQGESWRSSTREKLTDRTASFLKCQGRVLASRVECFSTFSTWACTSIESQSIGRHPTGSQCPRWVVWLQWMTTSPWHWLPTLCRLWKGYSWHRSDHCVPITWPVAVYLPAQCSVGDTIIYLLQKAHSALDRPNTTVCIAFFKFSSTFNTIQPRILKEKLEDIRVDSPLIEWITDYLMGRLQFVGLQWSVSEHLIYNIRAPQGTVLSSFLFTT